MLPRHWQVFALNSGVGVFVWQIQNPPLLLYFKRFTPFAQIGSNSPMPIDMKTTVPRIKETDIQVMNDVVGKGKFGNVNRGFIKKGTRNTEVAFKTLRGKKLLSKLILRKCVLSRFQF